MLILGNGFDLDLGLGTSYSDFIQSEIFKDIVPNNPMATAAQEECNIQQWIDLEVFIKNYIIKNHDSLDADHVKIEFEEISNALLTFMDNIDYSRINPNSNAAKLLRSISHNDSFMTFNFNYTNFQQICRRLNVSIKFQHIHGNTEDKDIILGTEDSNEIPNSFRFIAKTRNPNYKSSELYNSFNHISDVIIFGHSMGITDNHYFSSGIKFREKKAINSTITIFTRDKSSLQDIFNNIGNICENGMDEFRKRNSIECFFSDNENPNNNSALYFNNLLTRTQRNLEIQRHGDLLWEYGY